MSINMPSCSVAVRGMMLSELPTKPFPDEQQFTIYVSEAITPNLLYGQLVSLF